MNYTYEFLKIEPKQLFVQVEYSSEGRESQYRNLRATDFSIEGLNELVERNAVSVVAYWQAVDAAPLSVELPPAGSGSYVAPLTKELVPTDQPGYDEFTQRLEETASETDTQIIQGWDIVALSAAEQSAFLAQWRTQANVTMRQARLALKEQGLLATVQTNISAMPEDSQIEWEYAGQVERASSLVSTLGAALALNDADLDNLFKLAATK
jgi:hypothetical protein